MLLHLNGKCLFHQHLQQHGRYGKQILLKFSGVTLGLDMVTQVKIQQLIQLLTVLIQRQVVVLMGNINGLLALLPIIHFMLVILLLMQRHLQPHRFQLV